MKCANASTKCRSGSGSASQRLVKQNEFDLLAPLYRLTPTIRSLVYTIFMALSGLYLDNIHFVSLSPGIVSLHV